jgi:hypothetical protein
MKLRTRRGAGLDHGALIASAIMIALDAEFALLANATETLDWGLETILYSLAMLPASPETAVKL